MGLFSFLSKNKQDPTDEDSGYVSRDDDDAVAARARSKRASSAGEPAARRGKDARTPDDPVLPEKKRARRRLVGAIALALGVAIGLPMLLDSEPKPLATDIDIRIPSKDQAPPQQPARTIPAPVAAADSVDQDEEIVEAPKSPAAAANAVPVPLPVVPREVAEAKPATPKTEVKPKPADRPAEKSAEKPAVKPAAPKDTERALAILEDKPVPAAAPAGQKYIVQVAALASQEKASELQARLKENGIPAFTQKSGELVRVRVGPFSKEEGEKIRTRLVKLGLSGSVVPN